MSEWYDIIFLTLQQQQLFCITLYHNSARCCEHLMCIYCLGSLNCSIYLWKLLIVNKFKYLGNVHSLLHWVQMYLLTSPEQWLNQESSWNWSTQTQDLDRSWGMPFGTQEIPTTKHVHLLLHILFIIVNTFFSPFPICLSVFLLSSDKWKRKISFFFF